MKLWVWRWLVYVLGSFGSAALAQPEGCGDLLARPRLLPTGIVDREFAGFKYHIEGELVPVLTVELRGGQSVYFEHHIMAWKAPAVAIQTKPVTFKGALRRKAAGMQIFVTETRGDGWISFSRDSAGHIFPLELRPGAEVDVREHQFLAATQNIDYTYQRVRGVSNVLFGGTGFFIDKFHCVSGQGILWLHGYGNVFEKTLAPGEQVDVEPGAWLYKDHSVKMDTVRTTLQAGLFGWGWTNFTINRFTGPGRIALQSMYYHLPTSE